MTERVCIIGGGPAGMTAAITAARLGSRVTLLEHGERVGEKAAAHRKWEMQLHESPTPSVLLPQQ